MLFKPLIFQFAYSDVYPVCPFHELTGLLCTGCGNTRAVLALLDGHVLRSLGYNPTICILTAILLGFYAELVCFAFGKKVHVVPRSNVFLLTTVCSVCGYLVLRNVFPWMSLSF